MRIYKEVAEVLEKHLTDAQFTEFVETLDRDGDGGFFDEMNERLEVKHPELFVGVNDPEKPVEGRDHLHFIGSPHDDERGE